MSKLKYKAITEKIIGAAFEVHTFLGSGYQEVIYQRALSWEFGEAGLDYAREIQQDIYYKNLSTPIGTRRADFVVDEKVLVEIKAVKKNGCFTLGSSTQLSERLPAGSWTPNQFWEKIHEV